MKRSFGIISSVGFNREVFVFVRGVGTIVGVCREAGQLIPDLRATMAVLQSGEKERTLLSPDREAGTLTVASTVLQMDRFRFQHMLQPQMARTHEQTVKLLTGCVWVNRLEPFVGRILIKRKPQVHYTWDTLLIMG